MAFCSYRLCEVCLTYFPYVAEYADTQCLSSVSFIIPGIQFYMPSLKKIHSANIPIISSNEFPGNKARPTCMPDARGRRSTELQNGITKGKQLKKQEWKCTVEPTTTNQCEIHCSNSRPSWERTKYRRMACQAWTACTAARVHGPPDRSPSMPAGIGSYPSLAIASLSVRAWRYLSIYRHACMHVIQVMVSHRFAAEGRRSRSSVLGNGRTRGPRNIVRAYALAH